MASSSGPGPKTPTGAGFPTGAAIAAVCAAAILLGWHFWKRAPGKGGGLPPTVFQQAFALHLRKRPDVKAGRTPLNGVQTTLNSPPLQTKPGTLAPISPVLVDDSGALDPFFAALWHLEQARPTPPTSPAPPPTGGQTPPGPNNGPQPGASPAATVPAPADPAPASPAASPATVVTVLHYGDSPTTADLITGDARALLQARFGDAGHGFNLPAKPWAWYGHRNVTISDDGWKALTPVGSMREGIYGLGGATLVGSTGAKSKLRLADASQTEAELSYLDEPGGGSFSVSADGTVLQTISTDGSADTPTYTIVKLPTGAKEIDLAVTAGTVKMLGVDFRKGSTGVLYDSMGLNGASTTVMSRGFSKGAWTAELQHARPALVVINYGTNESSFGSFVTKGYENELRLAVAKVRGALPDAPILVMSPMDRGERAGLNDIQTMDTIPQLVDIQKRVAADLHCGFFDTFDAMGGAGTMANWYAGKPRLVSADLIHPTPQGALIVAQALVNNLMLGYDRWKRVHGILVTPGPVAAMAAPRTPSPEKPNPEKPNPEKPGPDKTNPAKPASQPQTQSPKGSKAPKEPNPDAAPEAAPPASPPEPAQPKLPPPADPKPQPPPRLKTPDPKTPDTES